MRLGQNARHFTDGISKSVVWHEKCCILILIIQQIVSGSPIDNKQVAPNRQHGIFKYILHSLDLLNSLLEN